MGSAVNLNEQVLFIKNHNQLSIFAFDEICIYSSTPPNSPWWNNDRLLQSKAGDDYKESPNKMNFNFPLTVGL